MKTEPTIAVGLVEQSEAIRIAMHGEFADANGEILAPGERLFSAPLAQEMLFVPPPGVASHFSLEATIGIDFHWQQKEQQTFAGRLRIVPRGAQSLAVVNDVPLETYITSVICSEMRATSPAELARAHAVISRSWLLAQLQKEPSPANLSLARESPGELVRWYDRESHRLFDVCADDHCQRYQGVGRIGSSAVAEVIADTRGQVLTYEGRVCDARFSKCCGGVTEDFRAAWSETAVPYLVSVSDSESNARPHPPLTDDQALRAFIREPPLVFCNCSARDALALVLNDYDLATRDFFRWQVRVSASGLATLVREKLGCDLGPIRALLPVARGLSGRLTKLRLVGEKGSLVIGKELEIRRALSPSHLYSSAFVVDPEGPAAAPDGFVLRGAGWGHGVGLCQIGAAAMAVAGYDHRAILRHYYPGTELTQLYA